MFSKTVDNRPQKKRSLKNLKSSNLHQNSSNVDYHSKSNRPGSQQLKAYRLKRPNHSQIIMKSSSKLNVYNSEVFFNSMQVRKQSYSKNKKVQSFKKKTNFIRSDDNFQLVKYQQQNCQKTEKKRERIRKPLQHNFCQIKQPNYKRYMLQSKREWEKCQIDFIFKRKYKNYLNFINLINFANRVLYQKRKKRTYNVYVGKGNNSVLVRHIFKNRFWWNIVDDKNRQNINIVWTQTKKQQFITKIQKIEESNQSKNQSDKLRQQIIDLGELKKMGKKNNFLFKNGNKIDEHLLLLNRVELKIIIQNQCYTKQSIKWKALREHIQLKKTKPINFTHNHLEYSCEIGNKKRLFINVKNYLQSRSIDPFEVIPLTFHVQQVNCPEFGQFQKYYHQQGQTESKSKSKNIWIVKPGENSNRGTGIEVFKKIQEIKSHIQQNKTKFSQRTFIIQKYICPFLFFKRKFDIRCYLLITSCGSYKAYFYKDGYIRTSSKEFSYKKLSNKLIHLTNDAIQKKSQQYGKFQIGNKISFVEFQNYLNLKYPQSNYNFEKDIFTKIIQYTKLAVCSTYNKIDRHRRDYGFQIFGLDFMIDENFKPWLIQINTNPCLELSSPLLANLIPSMLQNAFRIAIDPVFPPPQSTQWQNSQKLSCPQNVVQTNRFELIFDSNFHKQEQVKQHDNNQRIAKESNMDEIEYQSNNLSLDIQ